MVGTRQSNIPNGASKAVAASGDSALLDDVCLDRRYMDGDRVVPKSEQQLDQRLESIVDGEIIPRLMLLHKSAQPKHPTSEGKTQAPDVKVYIDEFTDLVLRHETPVVTAYVNTLIQKGVTLETLLLELLAPSARKLGQLWEDDVLDFVDVTIGTSRLQQVLHHFTLPPEKDASVPGRRVLLLPTPSEQHTFGLLMVSEFFRREGWQVWGISPVGTQDLPALVKDQWFALIGFSLSCERLIDTLGSTISTVRRHSKNRSVPIVVGGPLFAQSDALKCSVNADMAVADARAALELAEDVFQNSLERHD